ncbi:MAG: hypothetical protein WCB18_07145 [Thermoplasmata archaeon]
MAPRRKLDRRKLELMAERVRDAGTAGVHRSILAVAYGISPSTLRVEYDAVLLDVAPDLYRHGATYYVDSDKSAQLLNALVLERQGDVGGAFEIRQQLRTGRAPVTVGQRTLDSEEAGS